jgi:hypothetical protein
LPERFQTAAGVVQADHIRLGRNNVDGAADLSVVRLVEFATGISKMSTTTSKILIWLFVINLGIAFGAGLYEHRVVISRWITSSPDSGAHWNAVAARQDDTGRRFWAFVTTVPLTLLTLANLFIAWRASGPVRVWWLAAALAALTDRVFTFSYFIPTMVRLMGTADSPQSAAAAMRWSNLNYLRHAIVLVAWMASLKTFSLLYQQCD